MDVSEAAWPSIELVPMATDEVSCLIAELDRALSVEYPPEQQHGLALDKIFAPAIRFFVARLDGAAVGCCGVELCADGAEVKRMFVRDDARNRGVARALLARVEAEARAAGAVILRLETGDRLRAALQFYESAGFSRCEAFGAYVAMEPHTIVTSVFMEKRL